MRRQPSELRFHADDKPLAISLQVAKSRWRIFEVAGLCHEEANTPARARMRRDRRYRRAVTRRASRIFLPESTLRRQAVVKFGQASVAQFEATARASSRSPLARSATSLVCAKPGKAIIEAPRSETTARADNDLTILGC